jgi:hypothetical protein
MCCWTKGVANNPNANYCRNPDLQVHCHGTVIKPDKPIQEAMLAINFIQITDHLVTRGYHGSVPGQPACGCMEDMDYVSRSDFSILNTGALTIGKYGMVSAIATNFNNGGTNDLKTSYQNLLGVPDATAVLENLYGTCPAKDLLGPFKYQKKVTTTTTTTTTTTKPTTKTTTTTTATTTLPPTSNKQATFTTTDVQYVPTTTLSAGFSSSSSNNSYSTPLSPSLSVSGSISFSTSVQNPSSTGSSAHGFLSTSVSVPVYSPPRSDGAVSAPFATYMPSISVTDYPAAPVPTQGTNFLYSSAELSFQSSFAFVLFVFVNIFQYIL